MSDIRFATETSRPKQEIDIETIVLDIMNDRLACLRLGINYQRPSHQDFEFVRKYVSDMYNDKISEGYNDRTTPL